MIKKSVKWIFVMISMVALIITCAIKVYATNEEKTVFATVESNNVNPGSDVNIKLNLNNIEYDSYSIKLSSDTNISNVNVKDSTTSEIVGEVSNTTNNENTVNNIVENNIIDGGSTENNDKTFTISNVENLSNIIIQVSIPNDAKVGSQITLTITITDTTNKDNTMSSQITLNVVGETEDNSSQNNNQSGVNKDVNSFNMENNITTAQGMLLNTSTLKSTIQTDSSTMQSTNQTGSSGIQSTTQTVTYDGSDDNYLTNITIGGEDVSNFNKTNATYFKTVESGTTSIDISYVQSDSTSTVCVYGNTNLKTGLNKILIAVTAENGNVRNYRIYVTVES